MGSTLALVSSLKQGEGEGAGQGRGTGMRPRGPPPVEIGGAETGQVPWRADMMRKVKGKLMSKVEQLMHDEEMILRMEENYKISRIEGDSSIRTTEQEKDEGEGKGRHKRKVELLKWDGPALPVKEQRCEVLPGYKKYHWGMNQVKIRQRISSWEKSPRQRMRKSGSTRRQMNLILWI